MFDFFNLENLLHVLDVLIVAVFVYTGLALLRKTRSIFIFRGIITLVAIYIISAFLNLELTTSLFNSFFSFFVIILVVLFQRELRRFFENFSVAFFNPFAGDDVPINRESVEVIVHSIKNLAKNKIGALIVLTGRQAVDSLIDGGYQLDAVVSEAILLSIFDNRTPGHDGAVIIDNGLIKRFAAHLPLSDNHKKFGNLGTRHSAGLGLSERTDALVLIVSEERGTISVARNGNLKVVSSEQLKLEIGEFLDELSPGNKENLLVRLIKYDQKDKIVALFVAVLLRLILIGK